MKENESASGRGYGSVVRDRANAHDGLHKSVIPQYARGVSRLIVSVGRLPHANGQPVSHQSSPTMPKGVYPRQIPLVDPTRLQIQSCRRPRV